MNGSRGLSSPKKKIEHFLFWASLICNESVTNPRRDDGGLARFPLSGSTKGRKETYDENN